MVVQILDNYKYKITVFTPTYNRGDKIKRLYNSLCNQTFKNFEWVIIDNGTKKITNLVNSFIENSSLNIVYISMKKKGINRAYNELAHHVNGEMIFKVDDDDYLPKNSLEILSKEEKKISEKEKIAAISGLRAHEDRTIFGGNWKLKENSIDIFNYERERYGLGSEKAECYYTDIIKKFLPFPVFKGESYTDESILYNRIADAGYKIRFINKIIYIGEYLSDGITKNLTKKLANNLNTYGYMVNQRLNMKQFSFLQKIKLLCRYIEVCRNQNWTFKKIKESIHVPSIYIYICWLESYITQFIPRKNIN